MQPGGNADVIITSEKDVTADAVMGMLAWVEILDKERSSGVRLKLLRQLIQSDRPIVDILNDSSVPGSWKIALRSLAEVGFATPPIFDRTASERVKGMAPRYAEQPSDKAVSAVDLVRLEKEVFAPSGIALVTDDSAPSLKSRRAAIRAEVPEAAIYDLIVIHEYEDVSSKIGHIAEAGETDVHALATDLATSDPAIPEIDARAHTEDPRRAPEKTTGPGGSERTVRGAGKSVSFTRRLVRL